MIPGSLPGRLEHPLDCHGGYRNWMQEGPTLQAPPAPPCLCQQRFMPPANSIFASRDIREVPREKVVAYTRALQYWAEQNDPPTGGEPGLLAKSVLELREEVKWYLTFTDEEVFWGVAISEAEEEKSSTTSSPTDVPKMPPVLELQPKERTPKFMGWDKMLHPSWPVITAGEIPRPTWTLRLRGRSHLLSQMTPVRSPIHLPKAPSLPEPSPPARALALVRPPTPPWGFVGGNSLFEDARTCGGRSGSTCGHPVYRASDDPEDFQHKL